MAATFIVAARYIEAANYNHWNMLDLSATGVAGKDWLWPRPWLLPQGSQDGDQSRWYKLIMPATIVAEKT